jgi:Putative zinc-finger
MNCEETQNSFSPYLDGRLADEAEGAVETHLDRCPACRLRLAEMRRVVRALASVERPAEPAGLAASISAALMIERAARRQQPQLPAGRRLFRWLEPRLMPYTVGALTSVLLFVSMANALRPHLRSLHEIAEAARQTPDEATHPWIRNGYFDLDYPISLEDLARRSAAYGSESPSLNPRSDLFRVMNHVHTGVAGEDDDADDLTIVADVFSNGSASVAEVMQSPRDPRVLAEVQDALRRTPAFVPASLDRRPQTMRVVLSLSKVSVRDRTF